MNPNYVSPEIQANYPTMPYQGVPAQQFGYPSPYYQPMQPKTQNNAVNIEIIGPTASSNPNGTMPVYPGMTQVMQPPMMMPPMVPPPLPMPPVMMPPMVPPPLPMPPVMPPPPQAQTPPVMMPPMAPPPPPPPVMMPPMAPPPQQPPVMPPVQTPPSDGKAILLNAINVIAPAQGERQPTLDEQAEALRTISGIISGIGAMDSTSQQQANEMLLSEDGETFKGLAAIASSDTSMLSGPEKQRADEVRVMSLLTLATLQKYFRQEFDRELQSKDIKGLPPMPLSELPGIQTIEQIMNPDIEKNPEVREAGIVAVMGLADPENQNDIEYLANVLETTAETEPDDNVRKTAMDALGAVQAETRVA